MKIFILGGKGFIGSAFARFCERNGKECRIIDLDNYEENKGKACGLFINADGNSKKFLAAENPLEDFRLSVVSLLHSLRDFRFDRYVYISSVDVYPDCSTPATTVEDISLPSGRQSNYGFHKLLGELMIKHYAPEWIIVRLGGILGPGLTKNPVFDLLHDRPLRVNEESKYQYLPSDFVAETVFGLTGMNRWREVFNICGKGTVALREIRSWLNKPLRYFGQSLPREKYDVNIEKISRLFEVPESRDVAREFVLSEAEKST